MTHLVASEALSGAVFLLLLLKVFFLPSGFPFFGQQSMAL
jgi:hypothetical protein